MTGLYIVIGVAIILGVLAFVTRRRFGVLGLALAAGALLSTVWATPLVGVVDAAGISVSSVSTAGLVAALLVLAPALLLLFSGPTYKSKNARILGSLLFAAFAVLLLISPLSSALVLEGLALQVFTVISQYQIVGVTVGIIVALLDVLAIHTFSDHSSNKKSKH